MKKNIFFIILISLFFLKCEKEETYSEVPYITLENFVYNIEVDETNPTFVNLVGYLTIKFVDGDGDIGFLENSDEDSTNQVEDVIITRYYKEDGVFIEEGKDSPRYLPFFEKGIYRKHLKGEIVFKIFPYRIANDTIKYGIQIMDREYHLSNIETTTELIVPESF